MSNLLTIVASGKKRSGKSSLIKYIASEFLNTKIGKKRFSVFDIGDETLVFDLFNNNQIINFDYPNEEAQHLYDTYKFKIYSFADPLKEFLINVFGLSTIQLYGADNDKDSPTHINWTNLPDEIREKYSRPRRGSGGVKPATGIMTSRELMQVFGTDICRRIDLNCWARALYKKIENEGYSLALIADCRFPNEVTIGTEKNAKVIRLTRKIKEDNHPSETALDQFPLGEFSLVIDNQDIDMEKTHKTIKPHVFKWFTETKVL